MAEHFSPLRNRTGAPSPAGNRTMIDQLNALRVSACGYIHEYTEAPVPLCANRRTNLLCGHPDVYDDGNPTAMSLLRDVAALVADSATTAEILRESHTSRILDHDARDKHTYYNDPALDRVVRQCERELPKEEATAAVREAYRRKHLVVLGQLQTEQSQRAPMFLRIRDRLVTALRHREDSNT